MAYDGKTCEAAYGACKPVEDVVMNKVTPGGLNPYDDRVDCTEPPLCGRLGMEEITKYLNQAHVQKQIGVENQIDFKTVNMDLNEQWSKASELFVPTSREVAAILDKKHTRVLVINGNNDIIVYVCKYLWSEKDSPAANACL
ncbi:Carboxypeptidase Y-like protein [Colletotrichum sp. SAR 10_98]|nr:Carboxypeptidase Y-like protein [Colletotrichum sp. SAR 10_98]